MSVKHMKFKIFSLHRLKSFQMIFFFLHLIIKKKKKIPTVAKKKDWIKFIGRRSKKKKSIYLVRDNDESC